MSQVPEAMLVYIHKKGTLDTYCVIGTDSPLLERDDMEVITKEQHLAYMAKVPELMKANAAKIKAKRDAEVIAKAKELNAKANKESATAEELLAAAMEPEAATAAATGEESLTKNAIIELLVKEGIEVKYVQQKNKAELMEALRVGRVAKQATIPENK